MLPLFDVVVRAELPDDAGRIAALVRATYADIPYSDHREHLMVEALRASAAFVPKLSLIAEFAEEVVGHLMLTRIQVVDEAHQREGLALAPLSVLPPFQRRGVGRRLVQEAHARAEANGFHFIVLVGQAVYYRRFGYEPLDNYSVALPLAASAANRMILPLRPDAMDGVCGLVRYAPEWLAH